MNNLIFKTFNNQKELEKAESFIDFSLLNKNVNEMKKNRENSDILVSTIATTPRFLAHYEVAKKFCSLFHKKTAPEYCYTKNGKPFFEKYPEFNFSISHTEFAFAVAFSKNNIGVDIQMIKSVNERLIKRTCNENEIDFIKSIKAIKATEISENQQTAFFNLWCLKESFTKCISSSLLKTINNFYFSLENEGEFKINYKEKTPQEKRNLDLSKFKFELIKTDNRYSCALSSL